MATPDVLGRVPGWARTQMRDGQHTVVSPQGRDPPMSVSRTAPGADGPPKNMNRIAAAAFAGTAMEWYDYILYGTATAIILNKIFFSAEDPGVATLLAFATFAVGFVARPLGAVIFGNIGDRHGRRAAVVSSITLMGLATGLIGVLPSYGSVGILAPLALVLLRLCQGISAGGEWGGAMTLVLEHAPKRRHGIYSAIPQLGSPVATLASTGVLTVVAGMPDEQFFGWGWRIPFLIAFPLLAVALYLRFRVEESPVFKTLVREQMVVKAPLRKAFRTAPRQIFYGACAAILGGSGFFIITTFVVGYGTDVLGMDRQTMLNATLLGALLQMVVIVVAGRLADRVGAWKVCAAGGVITAVVAFPVFALVDTAHPVTTTLGIVLGMASLTIPYGPIGTLIAGLFPADVRNTAVSVSYNISGIVGGFLPLMSQFLLGWSGNKSWGVALLLMAVALVTAFGSVMAGRAQLRPTSDDTPHGDVLTTA